jgi:2-deoxy-D-gluconate 3-dehydrogenase
MEQKTISQLVDLSGKTAIVTGGAMGIGYAIASRLAEAGAKVLIADKDDAAALAAAVNIGMGSIACACDVSEEAQVDAMVARAVAELGGVDILVNNAGIYPYVPVLEATKEDFEKIIHINLKGTFFAARAVAKQMVAQGKGGSIINISSIDSVHPSAVGLAIYDASKGGVWSFSKNLALELAPHKIRVNTIAPGIIATPGTNMAESAPELVAKVPMGRAGEADDIGKVALFLASDLSSYMTGSQVVADGGILLA